MGDKEKRDMETITYVPVSKKIKWSVPEKNLNKDSYDLIGHINVILEYIIINTLQYNKLTSVDDILERLVNVYFDDDDPEKEIHIDLPMIDNICDALCSNNGVLIKLVKNNKNYYKLNHKNYL